jgi:hypothetical protein
MDKLGNDKNIWILFKIDDVVLNTSQVANEMNNCYINVFENWLAEQKNTEAASDFLRPSFQEGFPKMASITIMDTEIVRTSDSVNNKNLAGYEEISNKILKWCPQYLANPRSIPILLQLFTKIFPRDLNDRLWCLSLSMGRSRR